MAGAVRSTSLICARTAGKFVSATAARSSGVATRSPALWSRVTNFVTVTPPNASVRITR